MAAEGVPIKVGIQRCTSLKVLTNTMIDPRKPRSKLLLFLLQIDGTDFYKNLVVETAKQKVDVIDGKEAMMNSAQEKGAVLSHFTSIQESSEVVTSANCETKWQTIPLEGSVTVLMADDEFL